MIGAGSMPLLSRIDSTIQLMTSTIAVMKAFLLLNMPAKPPRKRFAPSRSVANGPRIAPREGFATNACIADCAKACGAAASFKADASCGTTIFMACRRFSVTSNSSSAAITFTSG